MAPRWERMSGAMASRKQGGVSLIMGLLLLGLWVVLVFWALSERQRQVEAKEASVRQVAIAAAEQTLRMVKLTEMSLLSAADWLQRNPVPYPGEAGDFIALVERLRHLSGDMVVYRFVDSGGNLYPIPTSSRLPVGNVAGRDNIKVQFDPRTRGFHISDPVLSPVNGKWAVPTTYPVVDGAGKVSVIAGVIDLDRVTQLFDEQRLKPNGSITLLKTSGTTLFRAPTIEGAIGRSLAASKDFTDHFNLDGRGTYHIVGAYDGIERIVSFEKLPDYGLIVAATTTLDDALEDWRRETWAFGLGAAAVTLLATALVRRFLAAIQRADAALAERGVQLAASNAELEQFAYVASHDLREPLRMVSSYLDLVTRRYGHLLDREGHEFVAFARDGARRMDQLVVGLLDLSRVERQGAPLEAMAVAPVIDNAVLCLGRSIDETGATVEIDRAIAPVSVRGDAAQIGSLFQNLIGNAIKYRAEGTRPHIRIACERRERLWEFSVSDNGIGIDPQYFERVFGIFQRLHSRDRYEGTGIGLAICKKIVERHGGRIWVDSAPGAGTTFLFTLPAA